MGILDTARKEFVDAKESDVKDIASFVPSAIQAGFLIPREYLEMEPSELTRAIKPTQADRMIRSAFWKEYGRAKASGTTMLLQALMNGSISRNALVKKLNNAQYCAWIMTTFMESDSILSDLYEQSLQQMQQIITMDMTDDTGKIDSRKAGVFLSAYKIVEDRVRGGVITRSENKTLNVKVDATVSDEDKAKRLDELKKKMISLDIIPAIIKHEEKS